MNMYEWKNNYLWNNLRGNIYLLKMSQNKKIC